MMLYACLFCLAVLACLHNLWAMLAVLWSLRFARRASGFEQRLPSTPVVLLLPMYQEASIVESMLSHFCSLDYPPELMSIVVITTAREAASAGEKTTAEQVKAWLEHAPRSKTDLVLHVHTDGNDVCKGDQLNFAMRTIYSNSRPAIGPETFVGVYDADSRPDLRVLRDLDHQSRLNPDIRAFQQGAVYFANWTRLPAGLRGAYLSTRPFYNLRFWMYRELPGCVRSIIVSRSSSRLIKATLSSPNHFLGHGEFVRADLLQAVKAFPSPSADTSLGTTISFLGLPIGPLTTFDVCETPTSISSLYRQGITWYAGCCLYLTDLKRAWDLGARLSLAQLIMCVRRWIENMIWCVGPLLLAATIILGASHSMWTICIVGGFACLMHLGTLLIVARGYEHFRTQIRTSVELPKVMCIRTGLLLSALYPVMLVVCCFSPITYYWLRMRCAMAGRAVPRFKTPRR